MYKQLILVFIIFFLCCTPVRVVSTKVQHGTDFQSYQTYNFLDVSSRNDSISISDNKGITLLKNAIARELEQRGYKKSSNPDLWVNIGVVAEPKVQTRQTHIREAPIYIGQRRYRWQSEEVVVDKYTLGTATVDLVDARQNQRVWEGVVQGTLTDDENRLQKRINTGIDNLFDRFPVNSK